jgi:sec-independent protein translocase protein TatC
MYAAVAVCVPVWLGVLLHFVFPALTHRQKLASIGFVVASLILALAAGAAAYFYLVPVTFSFLTNFVVPQTSLLLSADSYINFFLLEFIIAFVILQIPLIIVLLSYVRLLNPRILMQQRRLLYIGLVILLAMLTPTTDVFTLIVVSLPAIAVAEAGILVASRIYRDPQPLSSTQNDGVL